jgi:ectoine hydroxylase-related dioxygenase (phytanoyl-CoA dioxygenase family)
MLMKKQISDFQANGVVLLKGVLNDFVNDARVAIEENMAQPSWRERTYHKNDGSAPFFQDYVVWNQFDGYRKLVEDSPLAECAARLMVSKTARIFHDHILVKEPGNSVVTPWHQDQPYYLVTGLQSVSFWVPLDPIPRDRTIEYISGSHIWGKDFKPKRFDGTDLFEGDTSESIPDIDAKREDLDIVGWEMEPGDAIAFNFRTLHGAPANNSTSRRRVISLRWVGDDAVFVKRRGTTSPAFPDLTYEDGAPFKGQEFPILYSAK